MREMRENDKYVAGLLGLLVDKQEVTGKDGKDLASEWNHADTLKVFAAAEAQERAVRAAATAASGHEKSHHGDSAAD